MPKFFVPMVKPEEQEQLLKELAERSGAGTNDPRNCVYSITWMHDREEWTATVGEQLRGVAIVTRGRGRQQREIKVPKGTNDTVLAIFTGLPFLIAHDGRSKRWNMPILAGQPSRIVHFDD